MVKRVQKGVQLKRPNAVQSALIRRHFLELTQTFMIPLERYFASLMPLARNISPYRAAPKVKNFNPDEFIASLENCGPQLTSTVKGDWEGLYRRFFKSPNFVCWYNHRHREVAQKLQVLHLESLAESRIEVGKSLNFWCKYPLAFTYLKLELHQYSPIYSFENSYRIQRRRNGALIATDTGY